ncbi:plastocyanin/azurin family copper-binding protein [Natrinema salifodinae]|uniref:Copper binding protein, plastocyanin/azurin family n=1 Tax=Natrinema salifodinae TaxID=1202768 RepID=A0A1I0NR91_9EURY|nr:plastocyanin/azurin family copper-binding protein [Natrinema salifodinae]SEW03403.1 Copper binding protein, plastocyanin/azurin family [Natrinema salifodinae]
MSNEKQSREDVSRRGVLKGAAIAGTAAMAGTAGAYRDEIDFRLPATQNDGEGRTLSLVGLVGGWQGVAPAEIDGASNPTLRLIEGEENEVVWTNGDGSRHNFVLEDENGEVVEATDFVEEQGESTSLTFTPEEGVAEYYCMPHPVQMRGPVELVSPDEVRELRVQVEDEEGNPLEAEVFLRTPSEEYHAFSDIAARPAPPEEEQSQREPGDDEGGNETGGNETGGNETAGNETAGNETAGNETAGNESDMGGAQEEETPAEEDAPAVARFDMLQDGEYNLEVWTYGHERVTDTVSVDGDGQEVTVTVPAIETGDPTETYSFALEEGQWVGVEPDDIADEENPPLELEAGETYAVEWENALGRHQPEAENMTFEPLPGHNFVIASGGDTNEWSTYVRSNFTSEEGETQTVEFVAQEDMGVYLDQSQLDAVGEITVQGETEATGEIQQEEIERGGDGMGGNETADMDGNETGDGNETAEAEGNETNGD